jgi:SNF2 family DNA or RNA helicase
MYKFKTKPFDHQRDVYEKSKDLKEYAFFMEMGTGKSKVAIDTMGYLYLKEEINSALIIAPKGVFDNWVKEEIPNHLSDQVPRVVVRWQPNITKKFEEELSVLVNPLKSQLKIFVMNVEAFSTPKGAKVAERFLSYNKHNIVIVDESTTIKNRKAQRTKNILYLNRFAKYKRILTGSPITKSPMDLFSQCMFLGRDKLGFNSYFAFQGRHATIQTRIMGHRSFQEITGYRRLDELTEKLKLFSSRILKEECLTLPDKVYIRRNISLSEEQKRLYSQMKKFALAQLANGELATTQSVLTQIMRLQQICCGFFQPDEGSIEPIPNNRLDNLMDVTDEIQGKVIIWATYTHDIRQIADNLRHRFGAEAVATYFGGTPQDERQEIVTAFQDMDNPLRFFVGQPKTGGYGITLNAASTVIYFSNSYDLEIRKQSEDRAHRIGQNKSVTYIDFVSPDTIDEKILASLRDKDVLAGQVMGEDPRNWLAKE